MLKKNTTNNNIYRIVTYNWRQHLKSYTVPKASYSNLVCYKISKRDRWFLRYKTLVVLARQHASRYFFLHYVYIFKKPPKINAYCCEQSLSVTEFFVKHQLLVYRHNVLCFNNCILKCKRDRMSSWMSNKPHLFLYVKFVQLFFMYL